jgi:hypothetical protein
MIAMFDMGFRSATTGSNYDKARTLANLKLEQAKLLPFQEVRDNFPEPAGTPTTYDPDTGRYISGWRTDLGAAYWDPADEFSDFANFEYRVEKQYMEQPPTDTTEEDQADPSMELVECIPPDCTPPTNVIRVTVTVRWPNGTEYTTHGLVTL